MNAIFRPNVKKTLIQEAYREASFSFADTRQRSEKSFKVGRVWSTRIQSSGNTGGVYKRKGSVQNLGQRNQCTKNYGMENKLVRIQRPLFWQQTVQICLWGPINSVEIMSWNYDFLTYMFVSNMGVFMYICMYVFMYVCLCVVKSSSLIVYMWEKEDWEW